MKLATLDIPFEGGQAVNLDFLQPSSLEDFDTVVWDPAGFLDKLGDRLESTVPPVLSAPASGEILRISRYWRAQFQQLLQRDGSLVVLARDQSGLGVHTLQEVVQYQLLELLPAGILAELNIEPMMKAALCVRSGEPFRSFFETVDDLLEPQARLARYPGIPVLHSDRGDVLACYASLVPGRFLMMAPPSVATSTTPELANRFIAGLGRCLDRLGFMSGVSYAGWLSQYLTHDERTLGMRRAGLLRQVAELQSEIDACTSDISEIEFYKQILGGVDRGTRLAVAELFRRQGYIVQHDWLDERILIVETDADWLAVQVRLANEEIGQDYFTCLDAAARRIGEYFHKPARPVLLDCGQNHLAFSLRQQAEPVCLDAQRHGVSRVDSTALYGWALNPLALEALVDPSAAGEALRLRLAQATLAALQPASTIP